MISKKLLIKTLSAVIKDITGIKRIQVRHDEQIQALKRQFQELRPEDSPCEEVCCEETCCDQTSNNEVMSHIWKLHEKIDLLAKQNGFRFVMKHGMELEKVKKSRVEDGSKVAAAYSTRS